MPSATLPIRLVGRESAATPVPSMPKKRATGTTFGTMASIFYAIYFDAIRLAKHQFRATMSAMILTLSLVRGLGYFAVGEFGLEALKTFALFFPMMLIGVFAGDRFHGGIGETAFRRLVAAVLIVSGLALVVK